MDLFRYLVVLYMVAVCCAKFIFARNKSPLMDEEGNKIKSKSAECIFGKQVRELGSKWIPDLGPPIGILYCMQCECVKKKRKIVARVQCHNIKNQCPVPTCANPVVVEGRCCKTCPGDTSPDVIQDIVPQNVEDEEKNNKHYIALLTRRSSIIIKNENIKPLNDATQNNVVASGRFTFHKKNLYYSFYISEKAARPQSLQFIDPQGNILEEVTMSYAGGYVNSVYQNASRKVCGVWKRVAKEYKKLIRQEKMYATLVWGVKDQAEFTLSGKLIRNSALGNEMLSSLLEPAPGTDSSLMTGTGGTAIVSTHTTITPSINIIIIFNGIFTATETSDNLVNITLSMEERKQVVVHETIRVSKPSWDVNIINITAILTQAELRFLTRGHMLLSVSSVSMPGALKLSGNVITKATCELFQSTLTSTSSSYNSEGISGIAWLYLNNAGSLVYNIQIDNLPPEENPPFITLNDIRARRKTELEEIAPFFIEEEGWFTGVIDKLSPKVLEPLYSGDLTINVATKSNYTLIKGRLIAKYVADARDAPVPSLLKRENLSLPASVVGMAWISLDTDCHLHYDVSITGLGNDRKLSLWLEFYPLIAPGAPHINRLLDEFQGNSVEDNNTVEVLTKEEVSRLDGGVTLLKIKDFYTENILLKATLPKVPIPINCKVLTPQQNNNVQDLYDNPALISSGECLYEGRFYVAETSWVSKNPCQMCFCQNGKTKCDTMTCPPINCTAGVFKPEDECCPICTNNSIPNENSKCLFNGRTYSPGSKFHPFLIPSGFDMCTECYCDSSDLEIRCSRLNVDEKSCCKNHNCNKKPNDSNGMFYDDVVISVLGSADYINRGKELVLKQIADKVLADGGCKNPSNIFKPFPNGSEFHPSISTLGEYKCVTCKCQNGKPSCSRQQCDAATCKRLIHLKKKKQKINSQSACCSLKQCRKLRHKKKQNIPS